MTTEIQDKVNAVTAQIKKNTSKTALYRERLRLYFDLLELNFDNAKWEAYAVKFESDLSSIIKLEGTADAFKERAFFLKEKLRRSPQSFKISAFYPRNRYFEQAASDYLEAIRRASDTSFKESIYTSLGDLYVLRVEKAVSAADFQKWKTRSRLKPLLNDLQTAVKYIDKTLEIGVNQPYYQTTVGNSLEIYTRTAKAATQLGDSQMATDIYKKAEMVKKSHLSK